MNNDLKPRTKAFALQVIALYAALPKAAVVQILGKQLLRAGTSVGANYREASRSRSRLEFIAKMGDCLKELEESQYWLELLLESGAANEASISASLTEARELTAIFVSSLNTAKRPRS